MHHVEAGRISGAMRRLMATPDWAWRHTDGGTPAEQAATRTLRDRAERARRWLEVSSAAIGMPLPVGNGTNGPWHRIALARASDRRLGILDISRGRIAVTDLAVPAYVWAFAVPPRRGKAISPHPAGGSGSLPSGWHQIALAYGGDHGVTISPLPRPTVVEIIYGFRTCYDTIGGPASSEEYGREWSALSGVPQTETAEPQTEAYLCGPRGMDITCAREMLEMIPYGYGRGISIAEGGVDHPGVRGEAEWRVRGTPAERRKIKAILDHAYSLYCAFFHERAVLRCAFDLGAPSPVPSDRWRRMRPRWTDPPRGNPAAA
jgi:hypothetical protein